MTVRSLSAGLSYNSILGRFMVFSTDTDVSRKMLSINDPSSLLMAVHPSARNILGMDCVCATALPATLQFPSIWLLISGLCFQH